MFEAARALVLRDRDGAREALREEIARQSEEDVEHELDQLAEEEAERLRAEDGERARLDRVAKSRVELRATRIRQAELAVSFDHSLAALEAAFEELESLSQAASELERASGDGSGRRATVVAHARSTALVAAFWSGAPALARRLGIRRVPSGPSNARPLADAYPTKRED